MKDLALITGAASGIGLEFSKLCLKEGYTLLLVDRSEADLLRVKQEFDDLQPGMTTILLQDLSLADAADQVFQALNGRQVDVLINNAGFGLVGEFSSTDWHKEASMIGLHIVTMSRLCKLLGNEMKRNGKGYILNMASIAAFFPGPYMSVYYATKAYVLSFSRALAYELRGSGVQLTVLCPGPVQTNFQHSAASKQRLVSKISLLNSPQKVAAYGLKALKKGQEVAIPGFFNKTFVFLERFLPLRVITNVLGRLQRRNQGE